MAAVGGYSLRTGSPDPLLKSRARLRSQLAVAADLGFLLLIPDLLRNGLTSLALALGFAALARRSDTRHTLLKEWRRGGGVHGSVAPAGAVGAPAAPGARGRDLGQGDRDS